MYEKHKNDFHQKSMCVCNCCGGKVLVDYLGLLKPFEMGPWGFSTSFPSF
jgi:hypothetical protein